MTLLFEWLAQHRTAVIVLSLILLAFLTLSTPQSNLAEGDLSGIVGQGDVVVLEFYSNT